MKNKKIMLCACALFTVATAHGMLSRRVGATVLGARWYAENTLRAGVQRCENRLDKVEKKLDALAEAVKVEGELADEQAEMIAVLMRTLGCLPGASSSDIQGRLKIIEGKIEDLQKRDFDNKERIANLRIELGHQQLDKEFEDKMIDPKE